MSSDAITVTKARGSPSKSGSNTPTQSETGDRKLPGESNVLVKDGVSDVGLNLISEEMEKLSSLLPTMWIGTQSGRWVELVSYLYRSVWLFVWFFVESLCCVVLDLCQARLAGGVACILFVQIHYIVCMGLSGS